MVALRKDCRKWQEISFQRVWLGWAKWPNLHSFLKTPGKRLKQQLHLFELHLLLSMLLLHADKIQRPNTKTYICFSKGLISATGPTLLKKIGSSKAFSFVLTIQDLPSVWKKVETWKAQFLFCLIKIRPINLGKTKIYEVP